MLELNNTSVFISCCAYKRSAVYITFPLPSLDNINNNNNNACPTLKINYRSSFTGFLTCLPLQVVYRVKPLVAATSGEGGIFLAGLFLVTDWSDW